MLSEYLLESVLGSLDVLMLFLSPLLLICGDRPVLGMLMNPPLLSLQRLIVIETVRPWKPSFRKLVDGFLAVSMSTFTSLGNHIKIHSASQNLRNMKIYKLLINVLLQLKAMTHFDDC